MAEAQEKALGDIELIYEYSFKQLQALYKNKFQTSKSFKDMMLIMNQNMVEFQFMKQAGLV